MLLLNSSNRPSRRALVGLVALCLIPFAGCGGSSGGGSTPPPGTDPGPNQFSALLDEDQVTPTPVAGTRFRVTVTNLAPDLGTFLTPVWVGFHNGTFELFDLGAPADTHFPSSNALERLAEDGELGPLMESFEASALGRAQGVLAGVLGPEQGPLAPGESVSMTFELDPTAAGSRFMSYASMVIPSNDAFVANGNPMAHEIFDATGTFVAGNFVLTGNAVLDAGTEVNDEIPANTAFFGQTTPDTGVDENGVVHSHPGFLSPGSGGILDDPMFANADFTSAGYQVLAFEFELLPPADQALGLATVELVSNGTQVSFVVAAENLSGPATGAHFHQAPAGSTGPVVIDISDTIQVNSGGSFLAQGTLSTPQGFVSAIRAGNIYINIPTALNPAGELRGQLESTEAFVAQLDTQQEVPTPVLGHVVRVTVSNQAPPLGTFLTPTWVGFHDGTFEIYDLGAPASLHFPVSNALEHLAEDGDVDLIQQEFDVQIAGTTQGVLEGQFGPMPGPIAPGETVSRVFRLDRFAPTSLFFSYASMVIPSNDAFVANGDPQAHPLFDGGGDFVAQDFTVSGAQVLDAGTEVNDEIPANTAFFGQTQPGTGVDENGVVHLHPGFLPPGSGGILDDPAFANADFTAPGYQVMAVRFGDLGPGQAATGTAVATLNEASDQITFLVIARDLSGPVTGMHFHEGAPGTTGPVVVDLSDTVSTDNGKLVAQGTKSVTTGFVTALRNGGIYLNIHTVLNPSGEIRGQMKPIGTDPPPSDDPQPQSSGDIHTVGNVKHGTADPG